MGEIKTIVFVFSRTAQPTHILQYQKQKQQQQNRRKTLYETEMIGATEPPI